MFENRGRQIPRQLVSLISCCGTSFEFIIEAQSHTHSSTYHGPVGLNSSLAGVETAFSAGCERFVLANKSLIDTVMFSLIGLPQRLNTSGETTNCRRCCHSCAVHCEKLAILFAQTIWR